MERWRIGRSELFASVLGLGCNNFGWRTDAAQSTAIVHAALDCGVNFFDTADVYGRHGGSETMLGSALGTRRHDALIATKFGAPMPRDGSMRGGSPAYLAQALDASLARLGTGYIDLFQLHWPDPETPIADTIGALQRQVEAGKIRAYGVCNHSLEQIQLAASHAGAAFVSVQAELSLLVPDNKAMLPEIAGLGLSFLPYFPLASGLLTGKYSGAGEGSGRLNESPRHAERFLTRERLDDVETYTTLAHNHGTELPALALGWLAGFPQVASIIAGASSAEQVLANAASLEQGMRVYCPA